ncbi:MAG: hypothetical protein ACJAZ1_001502 [Yoonia sp.]|jgi:hypothetical protein
MAGLERSGWASLTWHNDRGAKCLADPGRATLLAHAGFDGWYGLGRTGPPRATDSPY